MNKRKRAQLSMLDTTLFFCDLNTDITNVVTGFSPAVDELKTVVAQIKAKDQSAIQDTKGITVDKTVSKKTVCTEAFAIAKAVYSYAAGIGNNTLKGQVNYSRTNLLKTPDKNLPQKLNIIYDAANTLVNVTPPATNPLVSSLVTTARLTAYQTLITTFSNRIPTVRNATTGRATNNKQLDTLFQQAKTILKEQLDPLALQLQASNPAFYIEYSDNRKIVNPQTNSTQLAGVITDSANGSRIPGVSVNATSTADFNLNYESRGDSNGVYYLSITRVSDSYTVQFTKAGYKSLQISVAKLTLGQTLRQDVQMTEGS